MRHKYEQHPDILTNTDEMFHPETDPIDVCDGAARMLIERGYPVGTEDTYTLARKIYEANYGRKNH